MRALGLVVALGLVACGDDDGSRRDMGGPTPDTGVPDAGPGEDAGPLQDARPPADARPTEDAGPSVPNIREVAHADCPDDGRPATGGDGPLRKFTLSDPSAICNDGSPAVMFIREAANAEFRDRWVFHLQGGGGCGSFEACHARWCSEEDTTRYSAGKMSSRWVGEGMNDTGIFLRDPRNPFGDANQVFVYYCSSDVWSGTRSDVVVTSEDGARSYSLHFRGHDIVRAVLAELASDDATETLPPLDDASLVLLTGTSAGQAGVLYNLDDLAAELPGARVLGVFDAGDPYFGDFRPELADMARAYLREGYHSGTATPILWGSFLDASCLAALGGGDDEFLCFNTAYVKANHVTTPFFQRLDLRDEAEIGDYMAFGATTEEFAESVRTFLMRLTTLETTAAEAASITRTPGVYGPNCRQHVALTLTPWFGVATIEDASGMDVSFGQALGRWIMGEDIAIIDTHPATSSRCETTTGDLM